MLKKHTHFDKTDTKPLKRAASYDKKHPCPYLGRTILKSELWINTYGIIMANCPPGAELLHMYRAVWWNTRQPLEVPFMRHRACNVIGNTHGEMETQHADTHTFNYSRLTEKQWIRGTEREPPSDPRYGGTNAGAKLLNWQWMISVRGEHRWFCFSCSSCLCFWIL